MGALRHPGSPGVGPLFGVLEGRFGIGAVAPAACIGHTGRGPGIVLCSLLVAAAPASTGVAALVSTRVAASEATAAVAAAEAAPTLSAGALGTVDLGVG